ncbi:MAG: PAS domain-containing protein, partial [Planctomycetaceae bacterium]|nr:PAS domain-containing protein [Planctomycetaceae bacterium]
MHPQDKHHRQSDAGRDPERAERAPSGRADPAASSAERLQRILEHAPDFILQVDRTGHIAYINRVYSPYSVEQV